MVGAAGLNARADVVITAAAAAVVTEALDLGVGFNTSASDVAASLADLFAELEEGVATMEVIALDPSADSYYAWLTYNIDRPMNLDGNIAWGCFLGRSVCSDAIGPIALWTTNIPTGYQGCVCNGETLEARC